MDLGLQGKLALVGGASRGIGRAIAAQLLHEGAVVACVARDAAALGRATAELAAETQGGSAAHGVAAGRAHAFACDLTDRAQVAALLATVAERLGPVELLVINAAVRAPFVTVERMGAEGADAEGFDRALAANLRLAHALAAACVPGMRALGRGRIVAIGSLVSELGGQGQAAYAASKGALVGLVRTLAVELGPAGITVNAVLPGAIDTARLAEALSPAARAAIARRAAVPRLGRPDEVAALVAFLCSGSAAYLTGAAIPLAGGYELNERW
jgi:3-oxoacyl-[acyl-carrier protein] reductase